MQIANADPTLPMSKNSSLSLSSTSSRAPKYAESSSSSLSPSEFLQERFPNARRIRCRQVMAGATAAPDEQYKMEVVRAIRSNDVDSLRSMLQKGYSFDARNSNGESLLHLACRRGNLETVRFLIHEGQADADVQDVMGRTVLHDVCWKPHPDFELMELLLLRACPTLLFTEDCRGHSCFDYARKEHWCAWIDFLQNYLPLIERRLDIVGDKR